MYNYLKLTETTS